MKKSKIKIFLLLAVLVGCLNCRLGCKVEVMEEPRITKAQFLFINQTQDTVLLYQRQCFNADLPSDSATVILPNDTLILSRIAKNHADIDKYSPVLGGGCIIQYGIGSDKCDHSSDRHFGTFSNVRYYEIRNQISPGNFELTYFFTEEKKQKAGSCIF